MKPNNLADLIISLVLRVFAAGLLAIDWVGGLWFIADASIVQAIATLALLALGFFVVLSPRYFDEYPWWPKLWLAAFVLFVFINMVMFYVPKTA